MNELKQIIKKMETEDLITMLEMVKQEINIRIPPNLTAAEKIAEYLILKNKRNVTSSHIVEALNMPSSTVRDAIRERLSKDNRFNVYLNRKPLEISYNGGKLYK